MKNATQPRTFVRAINTLFAVALAAFVLGNYWPIVKLFDLSRADLQLQGEWIGGHAKRITAVTPGGVAERAGLKPGDVLQFDPHRETDWVLAGYRDMPAGFSAALPVRHADGTTSDVTLAPRRVAYLPTLNDRISLIATLSASTLMVLLGVFMVAVRPSVMTWSLLLGFFSSFPFVPWTVHYLAFEARQGFDLRSLLGALSIGLTVGLVSFALSFPPNRWATWDKWKKALGATAGLAAIVVMTARLYVEPFEQDLGSRNGVEILALVASYALLLLSATAILAQTYRGARGDERARLKWALLGMSAALVGTVLAVVVGILPAMLTGDVGGSALTPVRWVLTLCTGFLFPFALGVAVLRDRVVDIQFAVSRTLVYGAVTTLVLIVLAAVHWLLGKLIEQTHLAIGLEGAAAIGLGLVLHRATHGINLLVDRVLFRKHHAAEERLRRVTAALPFATEERSIADALVTEPVRNLELASAALFYRESGEGELRRVWAEGWADEHVTSLGADAFLVRYLQAEHEPLRLDDPDLLPEHVPQGAGLPVLALPIVNQHSLTAVVLYGAHTNSTLPDPDEVVLLEALAKAAATSHQQVRIAMLAREKEAAEREAELQRARNAQLEASSAELRELVRARLSGPQGAG